MTSSIKNEAMHSETKRYSQLYLTSQKYQGSITFNDHTFDL